MTAKNRSLSSVIVRGASWTTAAQLTPLVVATVLTPRIIESFGLPGYGLFLLASTIAYFAGSFDGGVGAAVTRYSAVYAGADNRRATARVVATVVGIIMTISALLVTVLFVYAKDILGLFGVPDRIVGSGVFLLRCLALVVALLQLRSVFAAQLYARQMYRWISITTVLSYLVYAGGMTLTIRYDLGLRGAGITLLVQAVVQFLFMVPRAFTFLDFREFRPMESAELKTFLGFGLRLQATSLTGIINQQADTFLIARFLTVAAVGAYGPGATFAQQLRAVPMNILTPMSTAIAQAYGRGGEDEALLLFARLQRRWVQISTGWCSTALAASYFGIVAWLGPEFRTSAVVASMLSVAYAINLWTGTLTALLSAVGRPGLEVRYAVLSVMVNVILTVPLILWLGVVGTVLSTALGSIVASIYYLRIARVRYRPDLPSYFRDVPIAPAVASAGLVVIIELLALPHLPVGALGLIAAGVFASPGLALYALILVGPSRSRNYVSEALHRVLP